MYPQSILNILGLEEPIYPKSSPIGLENQLPSSLGELACFFYCITMMGEVASENI
jgi:hypothetical protein